MYNTVLEQPISLPQPSTTFKIAIVEDSQGFGQELVAQLRTQPDLMFTGWFRSVADAREHLAKGNPDMVFLDLGLPDGSGVDILQDLAVKMPQTRWVVLTVFDDDENIRAALNHGAIGYLLKRSGFQGILSAIRQVRDGESPLDGQIARKLLEFWRDWKPKLKRRPELTTRENELLMHLVESGCSVKQAATNLGLTYESARTYVRRIYTKLGVHNRSQAEKYLLSLGQRST